MHLRTLGFAIALLCTLAASFAFTSVARADWSPQSSGVTGALYGVSFADSGTGWVVGLNGTILATTDGGVTWTPQGNPAYGDLSSIAALSDTRAVAVGDGGMVLTTADSGATWTRKAAGLSTDFMTRLAFAPGSQTGYAASAGGQVLKTTDAGESWSNLTTLPASIIGINGVSFRDADHGMIAGLTTTGGIVAVTEDGGVTWRTTAVAVTSSGFLNSLADVDDSHAYLVGDNGSIWKSTNDGLTWTAKQTDITYDLYDVKFVSANTGIAVGTIRGAGTSGTALRTVDAGESWQLEDSTAADNLNGAAMVDASVAYACDNKGAIVKYLGGSGPLFTAASDVAGSATSSWIKTASGDVTLTASGGTGDYTLHYTVDGGSEQTTLGSTTAFSVSGEGSHGVEYWSTDGVSTESHHTAYVNIDTIVPATTDGSTGDWSKASIAVPLAATDSGSGIASTTYRIDGGTALSGSSVTVSTDGVHAVTYYSTDKAGNVETTHSCTVRVDKTAPATGNNAPSGWRSQDTTVSLAATDATSGVVQTTHEIDGGSTQTGTSVVIAAPADHSNDGSHVVTFRSSDTAGNTETTKSCTVNVDTTAPASSDDFDDLVHSGSAVVTLSAADAGSGVASTAYQIDGGSVTQGTSVQVFGVGTHTVTYWSTDNADNVEQERSVSVEITDGGPGNPVMSLWQSHEVRATLTPDAGAVDTSFKIDDGTWQNGQLVIVPAPADHSNDGVHMVLYHSMDAEGTAGRDSAVQFRIDTRAPATSDNIPSGWQHGSITVTLAASDGASGLASTAYSLDGGAWQSGTQVAVNGSGTHAVAYRSTDNAGNVEPVVTRSVCIDDVSPVTHTDAPSTWQRGAVTLTLAASDADSGVAESRYSIDGGAWASGSRPVVTGNGTHAVSYYSIDAGGNVESTQTCTVLIDAQAPTVAAATMKYKRGKLTATCRVADAMPNGGQTTARLTIRKKNKTKAVKTITLAQSPVNVAQKALLKVKLTRGVYMVSITATDTAGNTTAKARVVKLTVK